MILKQTFKAYNFYEKNFSCLSLQILKKILIFLSAKNYFNCNLLKRDRAALVGLPPGALGPQDIPHRRRARPELAGAFFRYINLSQLKRSIYIPMYVIKGNRKIADLRYG